MTFQESIQHKIYTDTANARQKINSLRLYGEQFLVVYQSQFQLDATILQEWAQTKEEVNILVLVLPASANEESVYTAANLQLVDLVVTCEAVDSFIEAVRPERLLYPEPVAESLHHLQQQKYPK